MENCVVGPYASLAFSIGSNNLNGTSSSNSSYPAVGSLFGGAVNLISSSTHLANTSSSSLMGGDLALGYDFGGIRTELSYAYSSGNTNNISVTGTDTYTVTGAINAQFPLNANSTANAINFTRQALLANVALDIPTGYRIYPYFGAGIGAAFVSLGSTSVQTNDLCAGVPVNCPTTFSLAGGTGSALAVQAKAGIAYMVNLRTSIYMEAVYDYTGNVTISTLSLNAFDQYSGKLGIRFRF